MNVHKNTKNTIHAAALSVIAATIFMASLTTSSLIKHKPLVANYFNKLASQTTPMVFSK